MITCNKNVNFGQPSLTGRRLTVYDIVTKMYYEKSIPTVVEDYNITTGQLRAAVDYCAKLKCKEEKDRMHYCDGCILRTIEEGWMFNKLDYVELQSLQSNFVVSNDRDLFFAGSLRELEDSEFGKVTWLIAEELASVL